MKILVDADACPVKKIIVRLTKPKNIPAIMITDTSHQLGDDYSIIITVDKAPDSVDFAMMPLISVGDIVITQDYGLAAMALGKGAKAINQNGLIYTSDNIDRLLMERHVGGKIRRSSVVLLRKTALRAPDFFRVRGGRTKGPAKRTKEDDAKFEVKFEMLLQAGVGI